MTNAGMEEWGSVRRKLRDIERDLIAADFERFPGRGKGSHVLWIHARSGARVLVPRPKGDMVPDYVAKQVQEAIARSTAIDTEAGEGGDLHGC